MKDNTILWIAAIAGGGYLLYKSGFLQSITSAGQSAGNIIDTGGTITKKIIFDIETTTEAIKTVVDAADKSGGVGSTIYNEYNYITYEAARTAAANPNHPLAAGILGALGSQFSIGLYGSSMQLSLTDAYHYFRDKFSSGGAANITGTPTASIPEKSTTPQDKPTPAATAASATGGSSGTPSATPKVTSQINPFVNLPTGTYNVTTGVYTNPQGISQSMAAIYVPKTAIKVFK